MKVVPPINGRKNQQYPCQANKLSFGNERSMAVKLSTIKIKKGPINFQSFSWLRQILKIDKQNNVPRTDWTSFYHDRTKFRN